MNTDKQQIRRLVQICEGFGLKDAVICPGSRNAPMTVAFNRSSINCSVIPDERVAGFFAMGIAQERKLPNALICTSGSASLNFAPAIVEAYYQNIPLLVLTADRPSHMVDKGFGQTINQKNLYQNYILGSFEFPEDNGSIDSIVEDAIALAIDNNGPVHINIPLSEPLYGLVKDNDEPYVRKKDEAIESTYDFSYMDSIISKREKIMILVGQNSDELLKEQMIQLQAKQPNVVVLSESTSNIELEGCFPCIDRVLSSLSKDEEEAFSPDLLISVGDAIVSKKIKAFLGKYQPNEHWNFGPEGWNTYDMKHMADFPRDAFGPFLENLAQQSIKRDFYQLWESRDQQLKEVTKNYLANIPWSDYKVFENLMNGIPSGSTVHFGNSTVVRYANLFDLGTKYLSHSNRGTSGIDGVTSTAMGNAYASKKLTTVITGDIAFLYDSNAFWHKYIKDINLKIILINNSGGGIFRIIPGPDQLDELETYFDCHSEVNVEQLVSAYGISYQSCDNEQSLVQSLNDLYTSEGLSLLEIKTDGALSAEVLRGYFKELIVNS